MAEAFVLINCLTPEPSIDMKELVIKLKAKISLSYFFTFPGFSPFSQTFR